MLSTTFIPIIIIMHLYIWHQSITTVILLCTQIQITTYTAHSPCFLSSLANSLFAPLSNPFYLLGTLLAVTGSVHLGLRLLVNWSPLSQPFPQTFPPLNSQNPDHPRLTKTTSGFRRLLSGTSLTGPVGQPFASRLVVNLKDGSTQCQPVVDMIHCN
jgi:hypothetical protein